MFSDETSYLFKGIYKYNNGKGNHLPRITEVQEAILSQENAEA